MRNDFGGDARGAAATARLTMRAAGVLAARQRGDVAGAQALMASFDDDDDRAYGFFLVAELCAGLLAAAIDRPVGLILQDLSLCLARSEAG